MALVGVRCLGESAQADPAGVCSAQILIGAANGLQRAGSALPQLGPVASSRDPASPGKAAIMGVERPLGPAVAAKLEILRGPGVQELVQPGQFRLAMDFANAQRGDDLRAKALEFLRTTSALQPRLCSLEELSPIAAVRELEPLNVDIGSEKWIQREGL